MTSKLPYDPQLVLGSVLEGRALKTLTDIAKASAEPDALWDQLQTLIASRRRLDMTKTELSNLGIENSELADIDKNIGDLNKTIVDLGKQYAQKRLEAENQIRELQSKISSVHADVESPIDYYFSLDSNKQDAFTFAQQVGDYVASSFSWLGQEVATQISQAASTQVSSQTSKHTIIGTLVITASCSHKTSKVLAPLVIDVNKAIGVWNTLFPDDNIPSTSMSLENAYNLIKEASANTDGKEKNRFTIISGMTMGSCFVCMVHILNTSNTAAQEIMQDVKQTLQVQAQMDAASWFAKMSGGFGADFNLAESVKSLFSTQNIQSHVTLACLGVIPSIVSNEVQLSVEGFSKFDPASSMEALSILDSSTADQADSIKGAAEAARKGQEMVTLKTSTMKAALTALGEIDDGRNKVLDINSMMTAFEDYLRKVEEGDSGIPVNYYTKDYTKDVILKMWIAKYYPGRDPTEIHPGGDDQ